MPKVRCITLTQPFASLVVMGLKTNETRGYKIVDTKIRQQIKEQGLFIHAGIKTYVELNGKKVSCRQLCYEEHFKEAIGGGEGYDKLPFGAIIGRVDYDAEWLPTDEMEINHGNNRICRQGLMNKYITPQEFAFGDYSPGRFAWWLKNPVQFKTIIPCKGNLSVWEYNFPEFINVPNQNAATVHKMSLITISSRRFGYLKSILDNNNG